MKQRGFTESFSHISYVHGPNIGMIWMCVICAALLGVAQINQPDLYLNIAFFHLAIAFLIIAMCVIWSIVRFEQRYN